MLRSVPIVVVVVVVLPLSSHALRPYLLFVTSGDILDEFGDPDSPSSDADLNPGSWIPILDPSSSAAGAANSSSSEADSLYFSGVRGMFSAASDGDLAAAAHAGNPHAQSALGFLHAAGIAERQSRPKAVLYHQFASDGGTCSRRWSWRTPTTGRQDTHEKAAKLYAELAEVALASVISKEPPVIEHVRVHSGNEENKEALRKSRGENDEDFQITEYQALKGNAAAMYKIGVL